MTDENIRNDVSILMTRMLRNDNTLFMFGEDGNGQHGRSSLVFHSEVSSICVRTTPDGEHLLLLYVKDYDSTVTGHAATDKNLEICLNMKFKQEHVDHTAWGWAPLSLQGTDYITLTIDAAKLLCS